MPLSKIDSDSLNTPITAADLAYTGTLTGSTGIVNIGSGQVYKDASGNVGIGTSSPSATLHVTNANLTSPLLVGSQTDSLSWGGFFVNGATSSTAGNGIYGKTGASFYYNVATGLNHVWTTNGAEKMRIDSGGNLLLGLTVLGGSERLSVSKDNNGQENFRLVNTSSIGPWGMDSFYSAAAPNGTSNFFHNCRDTGGNRFTVRSNGGVANYSANNVNYSDRREKTNFAPAKSYLDVICAIPVQTFNYIDQNMEEDAGLTLGVVAQDVQAVAPELVSESNWAGRDKPEKMRLSIYQTDLQYALMKCIQELKAIVDAQGAEIAALKGTP